jgi:hypothetical protein
MGGIVTELGNFVNDGQRWMWSVPAWDSCEKSTSRRATAESLRFKAKGRANSRFQNKRLTLRAGLVDFPEIKF